MAIHCMWMAVLQRPCKMNHFVVLGVTGCGKSTVAELLAERLNGEKIEADDLHGVGNIEKMQRGEALTDEDRWPWLARVGEAMKNSRAPVLVSCSALRRSYRQFLIDSTQVPIGFIHLHAEREVIVERMSGREGHFMPLSLLDSQLKTLELLESDEDGVVINVAQPIQQVIDTAMVFLRSQC